MDGKASKCEVSLGEGDTAYLRRELGSVLAAALAAVVELQPSDPVDMLALYLLKFRELNPLPANGINSSDAEDLPKETPHAVITRPPTGVPKNQPMYSGQIVQSCDDDDFSADFEYQGPVQLDDVVHNDIVPMFTVIGDLFDDDDLG